MTATLPEARWRHRAGLDALLAALGEGNARFVGGAVRDTLLGLDVSDVDLATTLPPATVLERLNSAAIKAVPTGMAHGTITAVLADGPVEITTLRRDVDTDGRRATIAYTDDWREDAARRDFTINALFADPATGAITDYFGGIDDLREGRVRFIGDAAARIAEDHLRILRFFRFHARFGNGAPDRQAYAACMAQANSLMALSRERIADELLKLLALPDPAAAVALMVEGGILLPVLPEIAAEGLERLIALIDREKASLVAPSAIRRLSALLPPDPAIGDAVAARLKLSNKARKRIVTALSLAPSGDSIRQRAYWIGSEGAVDQALLRGDDEIAPLIDWTPPAMPLSGGALIQRGLPPGPDVAKALKDIEAHWVAADFPAGDALNAIADQIVWKFQRARQ